jgi:3-oxoacyl-[acyl-carrier protein] reductase
MDLELKDKVAVITGSSRGLGLASARALVQEGCHVVVCARGALRLSEAADELRHEATPGVRIHAVQTDVTTEQGVRQLFDETLGAFGGLDVLVNNVGAAGGAGLLETTDDEWEAAFRSTLVPAVRASRQAVPLMRQRGGGVILIMASIFGREAGGRLTYNAVKAAEISLAKALAQQLAGDNIRVNSVAPGSILFEGGSWWTRQQEDPKGIDEFIRRELPFGRFGRPDEIGAVVAFLASPRASWISGACIPVDGGQGRSNI